MTTPETKLGTLLIDHGTPAGKLRGLLWQALTTDIAKALPMREVAQAFVDVAARLAYGAGMELPEAQQAFLLAYAGARDEAQLPPLAAPEPGS